MLAKLKETVTINVFRSVYTQGRPCDVPLQFDYIHTAQK